MKKVLIIENEYTEKDFIISGSYWFRLEMAYGLKRLGWEPYLIQHPNYDFCNWVNGEKLTKKKSAKDIQSIISNYDLVVLLDDIPVNGKVKSNDTPIIYWDIEGFINSKRFFTSLMNDIKEDSYKYYGAKFSSITNVLKRFQYHLEKQELQHWNVDKCFSAAKKPLISSSLYLPLGAEPDLYIHKKKTNRDISFAIIGSTSRWFQAKERIEIAKKDLRKLNFPVTYWYGAMPENEKDLPKNCFPMGHIDFKSLPNFLQRIKTLLHIPRPYHLESECYSATIFQASAAGVIPIHHFCNSNDLKKIAYNIHEVNDLTTLRNKEFPEDFSYKSRFAYAIKQIESEI